MLERRERTVSVCVPTLDEALSIERTLAPLVALLDDGLVDQVAVVDSGSAASTRELVFQSVVARLREEGRLTGLTSSRLHSPEEPGAEPRSVRVVQRPPMAGQPARGAA